MQFSVNRETLLKPLQLVTAVIERRQTLPILSNVFLDLQGKSLSLFGTDMEIELSGRVDLEKSGQDGRLTAPARKLVDICRSFPEASELRFQRKGDRLVLECGRSRFNLGILPASDFPIFDDSVEVSQKPLAFTFSQKKLRALIEATNFAMAQQDVRYYLNGMLWELTENSLRAVATDGHRLAVSVEDADVMGSNQIIVPRKAVYELSRLLTESDDDLTILLSNTWLRINIQNYTFTSKLIDGKFPDYDRVIPQGGDKFLTVDRDLFRDSLARVGVLSDDKHRGVCLEINDNRLGIFANNLVSEDAEDYLDVLYVGDEITIAFNITYLMDVLNNLPSGLVKITLSSAEASVRLESVEENSSVYVIMPMRL